jgi:hypothetical protein
MGVGAGGQGSWHSGRPSTNRLFLRKRLTMNKDKQNGGLGFPVGPGRRPGNPWLPTRRRAGAV